MLLLLLLVLLGTAASSTLACTAGTTCDAVAEISFSISGTNRVITSGGCPGYVSTATSPGVAVEQCITESLPLTPQIKTTGTGVGLGSCVFGSIGRAINGVALYSPCDANGNDAFINEGSSFDPCSGHWTPEAGEYHYHICPPQDGKCIPGFTNTSGVQHSPILGFMIDGVPIYGPYGDNGVVPSDLDSCGGHTDSTYAYYHYHTPATQTTYPYLVSCLKGCVPASIDSNIDKTCTGLSTTQYDYSSLADYGISTDTASVSPGSSPSQTGSQTPSAEAPVGTENAVTSSHAGTSSKSPKAAKSPARPVCKSSCLKAFHTCKQSNGANARKCRTAKKNCVASC